MRPLAKYECLSAPTISSAEKLKPDADGYYRVVVGGFDMENECGEHYFLTDAVKAMFEQGGIVRRRLDRGYLRGEYQHPVIDGMKLPAILKRLATIDTLLVSHHFKDLELVESKDDRGRSVVLVYGMVTPSGPYADSLTRSLDNRAENVAFSVRAFSNRGIYKGRQGKLIRDVLTYDHVAEPGIRTANQFDTVAMESIAFGPAELQAAMELIPANDHSMENDQFSTLTMVRDSLGWNKVQILSSRSFDI